MEIQKQFGKRCSVYALDKYWCKEWFSELFETKIRHCYELWKQIF